MNSLEERFYLEVTTFLRLSNNTNLLKKGSKLTGVSDQAHEGLIESVHVESRL